MPNGILCTKTINLFYVCTLMIKTARIFLFILCACILAHSQDNLVSYNHISTPQGLAHKRVYCGAQDNNGFIWFGTERGLQRYDGKNFRLFNKHNNGLLDDVVTRTVIDNHQHLWLMYKTSAGYSLPQEGFIQILDLKDYKLKSPNEIGLNFPFDYKKIFEIATNEKKEILFIVRSNEDNRSNYVYLLKLDQTFQKIDIKLQIDWLDSESILFKDNIIIYPYDSWGYSYNLTTNKIEKLSIVSSQNKPACIEQNGKVNFMTGVFQFDPITGTSAAYVANGNLQLYQNNDFIDVVDKLQWKGETKFELNNYFTTSNGDKWICTNNGVYQILLKSNRFKSILSSYDLMMEGNADYQCRNIFTDENENLYINSWGGIYKLRPDNNGKNSKPLFKITSWYYTDGMYFDNQNIWIGYDGFNLAKFSKSGKLEKTYILEKTNNKDKNFWTAIKTQNGALIIATYEEIILEKNDQFVPLKYANGEALPKCAVQQFYYTKDGTLWAVSNQGLFAINANNVPIAHYHEGQKNNNLYIPATDIRAIVEDSQGIIWLCAYGIGLIKWDRIKQTFNTFSTKEGLSNNYVSSILEDDLGYLWIGSDNGLIRFNKQTTKSHTYTIDDGLTHNEFNRCAFHKDRDGTLYFGGLNGVNAFNPHDFVADTLVYQAPLYITNYTKHNGETKKIEDLTDNFNIDPKIELGPDDKFFSIDFRLLDFTKKNHAYAYQIEDFSDDWVNTNESTLRLSGMPYGKYRLNLKSLDVSYNASSDYISVPLIVHAPFYATWWFKLLAFLAIIGLAYYIIKDYLHRQKILAEGNRLKELDTFKTRFFTNISHEFRTPLTVILGSSDLLLEQKNKISEEDHDRKVNLIKRNGNNLLRLINQILDLAKLESKTLKLNYILGDAVAYIKYLSESFLSLAEVNDIKIIVDSEVDSVIMDYDPDRLMQIVHNLMSNAIKFSPNGSQITVHISQENGELIFALSDQGIGIPASEIDYVFERFFQAKNQTYARSGGSGIGLAFTKELVQMMGGTIKVESPINGQNGTRFTFLLPIKQDAEIKADEARNLFEMPSIDRQIDYQPSDEIKETHILLIEDNADVLEYLIACFKDEYNISFALNGQLGIEKAIETIPDLIISDIMMPVKDGYDVLDELKNDERTSHIPIIILSAKAGTESRIKGIRSGADAYLSKPFHKDELMTWVQALISRKEKWQARYGSQAVLAEILPDNKKSPTESKSKTPKEKNQFDFELEDAFIQKVNTYLEKNYRESEYTVDQLCQNMNLSRSQLYRKLKTLTDLPIIEYINLFRLKKAYVMLQHKTMNVSEVAYACGYNDPKYFSRLFSAQFGISPSEL
ncbi:MAG: response regulator [Saprospiraceae bacterium]|nr:response regulator [Saprospiraceae bacterium]